MTAKDVRDARAMLGMTQVEFGRCIGVVQSTVWRLEAGKSSITPSRAQGINNLLALRCAGRLKRGGELCHKK